GQIAPSTAWLAKVEVCGIQRDVDLTLVGAVDERCA
ncbi:hydrogenase assembly chaperone, partial [Klebsiella pneumoniae]